MFGPTPNERMIPHHVLAFEQHGDAVAPRRILRVEHRHQPLRDGRSGRGKRNGADDRQDREQPEVLDHQQHRRRSARADPGHARRGQCDRQEQRRHHERRPRLLAGSKSSFASGDADDQHQQTRIGHVVTERALRTLIQLIVVEQAVLKDAEGGGRRADRHDHASASSSARRAVRRAGRLTGTIRKSASCLQSAKLRRGSSGERCRQQRPAGVGQQRPEERAAPRPARGGR